MSALNHPYIVLIPGRNYATAYVHVKQGQGKQARRQPLDVVRVPGPLTRASLPNVLRLVAEQLELDPLDRWTPPGGGLGSPSGAVGGEGQPSTLT